MVFVVVCCMCALLQHDGDVPCNTIDECDMTVVVRGVATLHDEGLLERGHATTAVGAIGTAQANHCC